MKKNKYTDFFNSITPDATLKANIIDETKKRSNNICHYNFRKVLVAAAVICAIAICGLAVSAKEEIIDLKALFPRYFKVESEQITPVVTGNASDIKTEISDESYQISVKSVMGDGRSIIAIFELSRKDGTPVSQHFLTDAGDMGIRSTFNVMFMTNDPVYGQSVKNDVCVNENGNVEYAIRLDYIKELDLDGQIFTADAVNLISIQKESEIYDSYYSTHSEPDEAEMEKLLNDSVLLNLNWKASFKYNAPENAPKTLICTDIKPKCTLSDEGTKTAEGRDGFSVYNKGEYQAEIVDMSFSSLLGTVTFRFPYDGEYFNYGADLNHCYIIKKDGSCLSICPIDAQPITENGICTLTCKYVYSEGYVSEMIVDTSEIASVSINETIYPLS